MHVTLAVSLCFIMACSSSEGPRAQRPAQSSVDRQKEESAIRDIESRWRSTLAARDTGAIKTFYTEDAIYSPHGRAAFRGRDSVSARWAREFQLSDFKLERTPIRIEIAESGDLASEVGTCDVEFRMTNQPYRGSCTYTTTWRKENGGWKMASYMWNQDTSRNGR